MTEKDYNFDQIIIDGLGELPPSETEIMNTTPWRKPIGFITWGFALTTLKLNVLYLEFTLPAVGVLLIFLGFRSLRNENGYFKAAWLLSIVKLFAALGSLIMLSSPLDIPESAKFTAGTAALLFQITLFLVFHGALKLTFRKAGKTNNNTSLLWAALWTSAAFLIAISPLSESWLVFLPMILFYILIVRSLYQIGTELDDAGYVMNNAPVFVSNRSFGRIYLFAVLITVMVTCIYFNHLKLSPQEYHQPEVTATRQHLIDMKFPAEALQYLSDDEVLNLQGAVSIHVFDELLMFDASEIEHRETYGDSTQVTVTHKPGKQNVKSTTVYIEMPYPSVYVLQYFAWEDGSPVWQDAIQIAVDSQTKDFEISSSGLFFTRRGVEYTADFPRLRYTNESQASFFGSTSFPQILGAFSFPFGSDAQGGFVLYHYSLSDGSENSNNGNVFLTVSYLNYVHHASPFHFPYADTETRLLGGAYTFSNALKQHYTRYDSLLY